MKYPVVRDSSTVGEKLKNNKAEHFFEFSIGKNIDNPSGEPMIGCVYHNSEDGMSKGTWDVKPRFNDFFGNWEDGLGSFGAGIGRKIRQIKIAFAAFERFFRKSSPNESTENQNKFFLELDNASCGGLTLVTASFTRKRDASPKMITAELDEYNENATAANLIRLITTEHIKLERYGDSEVDSIKHTKCWKRR